MRPLIVPILVVTVIIFIEPTESFIGVPACEMCYDISGCLIRSSCPGPVECENRGNGNEAICNGTFCFEDEKRCNDNHGCYSEWGICNGVQDCSDGTDENPNFCKAFQCPDRMTKCSDGLQCIHYDQLCDGKVDCVDKSDELVENCKGKPCSWINDVRCDNGVGCFYKDYLCDGFIGCDDGSDEGEWCLEHQCSDGYEKCADGLQCVNVHAVCSSLYSGFRSCYDGSNDNSTLCKDRDCPKGYSKCADGIHCIKNSLMCDGTNHCLDDSDEDPGFCTKDRVCPESMEKCGNGKQCVDIGTRYVCGSDFIYSECRPVTDEDRQLCPGAFHNPLDT